MDAQATEDATVPQEIDLPWVQRFHSRLKTAIEEQRPLEDVLSEESAARILARVGMLLDKESTVLDFAPGGLPVVVVGDTHGQFLDVLSMLNITNAYAGGKCYIFNGDLVDRGSWGVELFLAVAVLKLADPARYVILRGNHESNWCTKMYGFKKELESKYPHKRRSQAGARKLNIGSFIKVFKVMPLAAVVAQTTLVLHGGLWRKPAEKKRKAGAAGRRAAAKCAKRNQQGAASVSGSGDPDWMPSTGSGSNKITLGTLKDLRNSGKGGADPVGQYSTNMVATDVLWSDPVQEPGLANNDSRGVGMLFGPDITKRFLEAHDLRMIVRSHEGPDARFARDDMLSMDSGYTLDHDTEAGKLVTIFSAPDYPQHQAGDERFNNKASVLTLNYPSYSDSDYKVTEYGAVERPPAPCFYDLDVPGSDDELNLAADVASDVSEGCTTSAACSGASSANGSDVDDAEGAMAAEVNGSLQNVPEVEPATKDCSMDLEPCASPAAAQNHGTPASAAGGKADCELETAQLREAALSSCPAADSSVDKASKSEAVPENGNEGGMDEPVQLEDRSVGCKRDLSAAIACAVP